jgi:hypothetical protein
MRSRGKPRVPMSDSEPPPTQSFVFDWKPYPKSLRITKVSGLARKVSWVGLPIDSRPTIPINHTMGHDQAKLKGPRFENPSPRVETVIQPIVG